MDGWMATSGLKMGSWCTLGQCHTHWVLPSTETNTNTNTNTNANTNMCGWQQPGAGVIPSTGSSSAEAGLTLLK